MDERFFLRPAGPEDEGLLRDMLLEAVTWSAGADRAAAALRLDEPPLVHYFTGWSGREGDLGMVAIDADRVGLRVAAAWTRLWTGPARGYGFVDEDTPELSIGVVRDCRGHGIGKRLLAAMAVAAAGRGYSALSLSVEHGNIAIGLYERAGFRRVRSVDGSWIMTKDLTRRSRPGLRS